MKFSLKNRVSVASSIALLSFLLATGTILYTRLQAQTTGSGSSTESASSSDSSGHAAAPADAPPAISLTVQSANPAVSGFRPGVRAYYSMTVTDDKALRKVVVKTSQMMYSGSVNDRVDCVDKAICEEKVYIIVPASAGTQYVEVTATDSAGQTATKMEIFYAQICINDAECGGGAIQWAGASYCGSETGGLETDIMQYGVAAICKPGGVCDTTSLPRVKQKCAAGQVCSFIGDGTNVCVLKPNACAAGAQISTVCTCGNATYNYPYDWRVRTATSCCSVNGSFSTIGGSCPGSAGSSSSTAPSSALNGNGAPATVTLIPLPQYGADKYSARIDDAGGIWEMSITKRDGSGFWGGSPGSPGNVGACTGTAVWTSLTSGTVTAQPTDFPLHVWGTHCASTLKYTFDLSAKGEVLPYTQPPVSSSSASSRPSTGSAATLPPSLPSPPRTGSSATVPVPGIPAATPGAPSSAGQPSSPAPATTGIPTMPTQTGPSTPLPQATPGRTTAGTADRSDDDAPRKLTKSQQRLLNNRKKRILRELITLNKTLKQKRNTDALEHLAELRADVKGFEPVDSSAYDTILDFQDEVADLRLEAAKKAQRKSLFR